MSISPWPRGQTQPIQTTLVSQTASGFVVPSGIASAALSLRIRTLGAAGIADITGNGVFSAVDPATGITTYTWGTNEPVNVPGVYDIYIDAVYSGPTYKRTFGPVRWNVV